MLEPAIKFAQECKKLNVQFDMKKYLLYIIVRMADVHDREEALDELFTLEAEGKL